MTICERCNAELHVGDFPFCPHGRGHGTAIKDELVGGFVQENFGPEPMTFYSKSEMLKEAKRRGLEPMVRWAGPHDRHVSRWAAMDPQTLANAAALCDPERRKGKILGNRPPAMCETAMIGWQKARL